MIVLGTTVIACAVGEEHPLRDPCRRILAAHADGRIDATTTVEVIQELVHVRARRRDRADAAALGRRVGPREAPASTSARLPRPIRVTRSRRPPLPSPQLSTAGLHASPAIAKVQATASRAVRMFGGTRRK